MKELNWIAKQPQRGTSLRIHQIHLRDFPDEVKSVKYFEKRQSKGWNSFKGSTVLETVFKHILHAYNCFDLM